jgi:hypothetical protein
MGMRGGHEEEHGLWVSKTLFVQEDTSYKNFFFQFLRKSYKTFKICVKWQAEA